MNISMPGLIMESEKLQLHGDGLGRDSMNAGHFCFNCEQLFSDRKYLEEHACSAANYICSCGTEFTLYNEMLYHSTTHEPGHQVLDHETIRKRRHEKLIEEEEQLKRLQTSDVTTMSSLQEKPKVQFSIKSAAMPEVPMQSAATPQVPNLYPSLLQGSFLQNPATSAFNIQNVFKGVGAPTADLWTIYQPVVLLQTVRQLNKRKPYCCGRCGQCFVTQSSLISHHSSHVTDKVSGCVGCGLLLSSKKVVPRFHACNSPNAATKFRLITAKPLTFKGLKKASMDVNHNLSVQGPLATFSLQLKRQTPRFASKCIQSTCATSNQQFKNQNLRTYSKCFQDSYFNQSLQAKTVIPNTSKFCTFPSQCPNLSASTKSNQWLPVTSSVHLKMPRNPAVDVLDTPMAMSSAPNRLMCRVCYLTFETAQLLQRHKCIKGQEFMAQYAWPSRQHYKVQRFTPVTIPVPVQINCEKQLELASAGNMKTKQVLTIGLNRGQNTTTAGTMADECYIVESGPVKPAEMIYQVTSSVPIKT